MDIGTHIAASGAIANQRQLEHVTHNLANVSTPGFKKAMAQMEAAPFSLPRSGWTGSDPLAFVRIMPPVSHSGQGSVEPTGRELDVAIEGEGYFQALTPQGVRSLRDGRFRLAPDGTIVTREGHPVLGDQGGQIRVDPRKKVEVARNGEVQSGEAKAGRLRIVDAPGNPMHQEHYQIAQGHLELSNVNAIEEMVRMTQLLRSHDSYMRLIKGFDDLESKVIQEMGKV